MKIRWWREGDLAAMVNPRSPESEDLAAISTTFTILTKLGRPAMLIGFSNMWEGCAQVWAIPSDLARGNALEIVRLAREMLALCAERYGIHRYQTLMHPADDESIRWIRLLGFHHESILKRAFSDGRELHFYVRFFGGDNEYRKTQGTRDRLREDVANLFSVDEGSVFPPYPIPEFG